jgi:hypothetical protein
MKCFGYMTILTLIVSMICASVTAETIFETFDADPTSAGWTSSTPGSSVFTYNTNGFLEASFERSTSVDRYTTALSQTYGRTQEFWWEMDVQIDSAATDSLVKQALFGVFNSSYTNAAGCSAVEFSVPSGSEATDRFDMHFYRNDGGNRYKNVGVADFDTAFRVKGHYYNNASNEGHAQVDIYDILTGDLVVSSGDQYILTAAEEIDFNLFGLGAVTYASTTGATVATIDNLYFSTSGENTNAVDPSFIPEPATLCLLAAGGLFLRQRTKK